MTQTLVTGETDAEVERNGSFFGPERRDFLRGELFGTRERVIDRLGRYREIGVERVYFQVIDPGDLDYLRYVAAAVIPPLR